MGRIRILSDTVANQIAAGEVVERPASVVKELLENSLDAGAASLKIEVESGGKRLIRVTDDGCGMIRDDALLAFERHATSKLASVGDLESIATLGFRGEALPSIGAVSRLLLETKADQEATGTRIEVAGGKMLKCGEAALARGTVITVRDLFFNVPARKKFLRTEQTELAHIASLATHYSLAHPDKAFELWNGTKPLLEAAPAGSLRGRVFQVFGGETLSELVEIPGFEQDLRLPPDYGAPPEASPQTRRYRLSGFVSRPQVQRMNRNSIFIFVNRRLIRDRLILHAISSAYHNLMPPACYPFALLFLECPYEEVDVNVHPSKTEVRFRHANFVHDFVRDAIRELLVARKPASDVPPEAILPAPLGGGEQAAVRLPYSEFTQALESFPFPGADSAPPGGPAVARPVFPQTPAAPGPETLPEYALGPPPPPAPRLDFGGAPTPLEAPARPVLKLRVPDTHGPLPEGAAPAEPLSLGALADLRPLGQIHDSFIVAAGPDGLWIIDQHVAHERVLFEQVLRQMAAGRVERQGLLMPIVLELTPAQQVEYAAIADDMHSMGFETEPFGHRTIAVKAAPAAVGPGDVERLIREILEIREGALRSLSLDDLRRGMAAGIACRAAIKVHTRLDMAKMEYLLRALAATDCPMSCPHGRPIALRYATRDILKSFHRV